MADQDHDAEGKPPGRRRRARPQRDPGEAKPAPPERPRGTYRVARLLGGLLSPAARRRGFAEASILADWARIVGPTLAARCQPVAITFPRGRYTGGVLEVRCSSGAAIEVQHRHPQIVERVNRYFGFAVVSRLRIVQMPVQPPSPPPPVGNLRTLRPDEEALLRETVAAIADDDLRAALLALGRAVSARPKRRGRG